MFRWFPFKKSSEFPVHRPPRQGGESGVSRLGREARSELLAAISEFLLAHDLAITPANLSLAWHACSGSSPGLLRRIAEKSRSGEKITQQWLDEISPPASDEREERAVRDMIDELASSVGQFTRSTSAARSATSEYHSELDRHVSELEELAPEAAIVSRLASLAQAMADRTRCVEAELKAREQESRSMRRRLEKARRDAECDHLTGLPNRRAFEAELAKQQAEAAAAGEPLSIAFCDIDHFKLINDHHGHEAGDRVLKLIAKMLADNSNDNCHVSRHGGEEFVLLYRGLTPSEAKGSLDRVREELAARRLINRETEEPFGQITFSAGVADVFAHADRSAALKAADGALYLAKESGRNRVQVV